MLNMKKFVFSVLIATACIFISCGDDEEVTVPVVSINSPVDGATFMTVDTMEVFLKAMHDRDITSMSTNITPIQVGGTLDISSLTDFQDINVSVPIPIDIPEGSYSLVITASDADGNEGSDEVSFVVQ